MLSFFIGVSCFPSFYNIIRVLRDNAQVVVNHSLHNMAMCILTALTCVHTALCLSYLYKIIEIDVHG